MFLTLIPLKAKASPNTKNYINFVQKGTASWYGGRFIGRKTASGEPLSSTKLTVAHKFLPLGTIVKITNLKNGKMVKARVNDRGPYVGHRIVDLSKATANAVDLNGLSTVKIEAISVPLEVAEFSERKHKH